MFTVWTLLFVAPIKRNGFLLDEGSQTCRLPANAICIFGAFSNAPANF